MESFSLLNDHRGASSPTPELNSTTLLHHGSDFGFECIGFLFEISEFGKQIEEAADAQDLERLNAAVNDLREFLETVKLPPP